VEGPPQYDLLKLQKFVASDLEKFLLKLTDNSEMERLWHADARILANYGAADVVGPC